MVRNSLLSEPLKDKFKFNFFFNDELLFVPNDDWLPNEGVLFLLALITAKAHNSKASNVFKVLAQVST